MRGGWVATCPSRMIVKRGCGVAQYVANGVVVGAIIALTAVGLTLVYSILRITNFAHGEYVTIGAYTALALNMSFGLPPRYGLPVAIVVGAVTAVAVEFLLWRRMRRSRAGPVALIVASIGLALFLRNSIVFIFSPAHRTYAMPIQRAEPFLGLPFRLTADQKFIIAVAALLVILLHILLRYTMIGKAMRAMSDNMDLAWICGVDVDRVVLWAWLLAGGLAAAGGVLYAMTRPVYPELGWHLLLPMFAALILGGARNPYGAIIGGLLIGIAQEASVLIIRNEYKIAVGFIVMILVLFIRPQGLLGGDTYR